MTPRTAPFSLRAATLAALTLTLTLTACGPAPASTDALVADAAATEAGGTTMQHAHFRAHVGTAEFSCSQSYAGLGAGASTWQPTDLRFYVSNPRFLDAAGREYPLTLTQNAWQYRTVALIDFEDATGGCASTGTHEIRDYLEGTVQAGVVFTGVRFELGVPFALDHVDFTLQPAPLNLTPLFWGWNAGYKFTRIDGLVAGTPFLVDLGSTGCMGEGNAITSCANPNMPTIELGNYNPDRNIVVFDLAALLAHSALEHSLGCESDPGNPDCAPLFSALGVPYGGAAATPATAFHVE